MTEKRFTLKAYDGITCDVFDNGIEIANVHRDDAKGLVECLNNLHEENEQLQKDCTALIHHNQEYRKENEQLKQTIKEVCELLEEEVDLFSDKATEHDICAYIELKEFDNKDAYYMATATKKAIKMLKGD